MNKFTKTLMIAVAVVFDIIELILALFAIGLILNRILTIIEYIIYFVWFWFLNIKFMGKSKGMGAMGVTFITEMIPFLGALPGLTIGVCLTIKSHEKQLTEESEENSSSSQQNQNVTRPKRTESHRTHPEQARG